MEIIVNSNNTVSVKINGAFVRPSHLAKFEDMRLFALSVLTGGFKGSKAAYSYAGDTLEIFQNLMAVKTCIENGVAWTLQHEPINRKFCLIKTDKPKVQDKLEKPNHKRETKSKKTVRTIPTKPKAETPRRAGCLNLVDRIEHGFTFPVSYGLDKNGYIVRLEKAPAMLPPKTHGEAGWKVSLLTEVPSPDGATWLLSAIESQIENNAKDCEVIAQFENETGKKVLQVLSLPTANAAHIFSGKGFLIEQSRLTISDVDAFLKVKHDHVIVGVLTA